MKEPDSLESLLREWKAPDPAAELDREVVTAYRSAVRQPSPPPLSWRRFWAMRVTVPAPALLAAALLIVGVFLWLRPPSAPPAQPGASDVVTSLNARGFQPLPNGEARVIPAMESNK